MAKITRYTGDLQAFASDSLGTERTVFGDVTQADDLDSNINTDFLRGWGIVGVNENPTKQDFNALGYTATQLLSYLHQMGMAEWDGAQEYQVGSFTNRSGAIYRCLTADHVSATAPESDAVNWKYILSADDVTYDNTTSGATATDVQGAIDEVFSAVNFSGHVIQVVTTTVDSIGTTTSIIPFDNTIPQITEGAAFMSLAITPKFSDSKIVIAVNFFASAVTSLPITAALFKNSDANAIYSTVSQQVNINDSPICMTLNAVVDAVDTAARTYSLRLGPSSATTLTFGGTASADKYSNVPSASIVIMEVAA